MNNLKDDKRWHCVTPDMLRELEAFRKMLVETDAGNDRLSRHMRTTRQSLSYFLNEYEELAQFVEI